MPKEKKKQEPELTTPENAVHRCQIAHCYCKDGKPIENVLKLYPIRRGRQSFAVTHPKIAKFWDDDKNCGWQPTDFGSGSHVVAWWRCDKGADHSWSQTINLCCRMLGCPFCRDFKLSVENSLASRRPRIAETWHPTRNDCSPDQIAYNSNYLAWWLCKACGYEWQVKVDFRSRTGSGCRRCTRGEPIDLSLYPSAMKLFDKAKNPGVDPTQFGTTKNIWWKCRKAPDHVWYECFEKRTGDKQCPFCRGLRASSTNNLAKEAEIAAQFHPTKNGMLKPEDISVGSTKAVWWQCAAAKDHEWKQKVNVRTQWGYGCPFCSNRKIAKSNCLKTTFPNVAKDWHPKKNGKLTPLNVLPGSARQVWWQCCKCKHEWKRAIYLRTNRQSPCPSCLVNVEGSKRNPKTGQWLPAKKRKSKG